jgi:hypothetical protein
VPPASCNLIPFPLQFLNSSRQPAEIHYNNKSVWLAVRCERFFYAPGHC